MRRPLASSRTTTLHGSKQPDIGLGAKGPVGERRTACTENPVRAHIDAEFGFHRSLNVDIGEDTESFVRVPRDAGDCVPEAQVLDDTMKALTRRPGGGRASLHGQILPKRVGVLVHVHSPWRDRAK